MIVAIIVIGIIEYLALSDPTAAIIAIVVSALAGIAAVFKLEDRLFGPVVVAALLLVSAQNKRRVPSSTNQG